MHPAPQPRAAPARPPAREPGARAPRTPRPARAGPSPALPRPGAGAARGRLPRAASGRSRACVRGGPRRPGLGGRVPGSLAGGAAPGGPCSLLGAGGGGGLGPSPPPWRCTAALRAGAAMNSAAERARGAAVAARPPARLPARVPELAPRPRPVQHLPPNTHTHLPPHARPRPTPGPARTAPRHILELAAAPAALGGNALLRGRPAGPPAAPVPASPTAPSPFRTPRPALTCSLAQPRTVAVGFPRSLARRPGRDGRVGLGWRGARWVAVCFGLLLFFFFWSLGRGRGEEGGDRARPLMGAALLLHEHGLSSRP